VANIKIFFFQFTVSTVKLYIRKLGCRGAVNYRPRHVQKLLRLGYQRESGGGVECSRVYPPDELSQVFIGSTRQVTPAVSTERPPPPCRVRAILPTIRRVATLSREGGL
jgi:hypothetical protein